MAFPQTFYDHAGYNREQLTAAEDLGIDRILRGFGVRCGRGESAIRKMIEKVPNRMRHIMNAGVKALRERGGQSSSVRGSQLHDQDDNRVDLCGFRFSSKRARKLGSSSALSLGDGSPLHQDAAP